MKVIKLLILASVVIFTLALKTEQVHAKCYDYTMIFARGSGQKLNDRDFLEFKKQIDISMASMPKISYNFYQLGSRKINGFMYPAVEVSFSNNSNIFRIKDTDYDRSVQKGAGELEGFIKETIKKCPNTHFILAGYSQGVAAIRKALPRINAKKISYIANFGDPNLYLPEGKGINPPACRGEKLSPYRRSVPDCRTNQGILGAKKPYEPAPYRGKIGLWCNAKDIVCGRHIDFFNPLKGHTSYTTLNRYGEAANVIAGKLGVGSATSQVQKPQKIRQNVAFVIDSTGSMNGYIEVYKKEAERLAKKVIEAGGSIALIEYKDLGFNEDSTIMHCNFNCKMEEFRKKIRSIKALSGGDDVIESALSASMFALNNLGWQYGVNKSIVLLTDAGFHNPDHDGTTLKAVVNKSLEIDPVNFYLISNDSVAKQYKELLDATAGKFFSIHEEDEIKDATDYIVERPLVSLPVEEYVGRVGETITFNASQSLHNAEIMRYEWDLDFDGKFEIKNFSPIMTKKYSSPANGFMQVKLIDYNGRESTMSARVIISETEKPEPEIKLLRKVTKGDNVKVEFELRNSDVAAALIDGSFMSFIDKKEIELQVDRGSGMHILSLVPISKDGEKGEALITKINESTEQGEQEDMTATEEAIENTATEFANVDYAKDEPRIPVPSAGIELKKELKNEDINMEKIKTKKIPKAPNTGAVSY